MPVGSKDRGTACKPRSVQRMQMVYGKIPSSHPHPPGRSSIWAHTLPWGSCSLPGAPRGRAAPRSQASFAPAWPCSRWRLPGRRHCCRRRWALTPPFHPYRGTRRLFSVVLCAVFTARGLSGIVLFGARTFLRLPAQSAIAQPTQRSTLSYRPYIAPSISIPGFQSVC